MGSAKGREGVQAAKENAEEPPRPGDALATTHPPFPVNTISCFLHAGGAGLRKLLPWQEVTATGRAGWKAGLHTSPDTEQTRLSAPARKGQRHTRSPPCALQARPQPSCPAWKSLSHAAGLGMCTAAQTPFLGASGNMTTVSEVYEYTWL